MLNLSLKKVIFYYKLYLLMLVTQGDLPITTTWVGYSDVG